MNEPVSLDRLFKQKIFRIPDYQRGYAWQRQQYKDFWEDLVNLAPNRQHYTGVLTLTAVPTSEIAEEDKEYWLIDDDSYDMFNIVDGQQRLTTFVIFLQSLVEVVSELDDNKNKSLEEINLTENLTLRKIADKFLFKVKPSGDRYRTYKFGYTRDNPSYEYLRHRIFFEEGAGTINETFYTLNLRNAKAYFKKQLEELYADEGLEGLQVIYKRLTKDFLLNEYIIKDEFDVFVAFETMNNRGKKLSDLELLKNRLIYLTTLYDDIELDPAERKSLRDDINDSWKEVYYQLGRNDKQPLNDDDFLKAHWTMFFKYSRQRGNDYIKFLLDEQFAPQRIMKKVERQVPIEDPQEQRTNFEFDDAETEPEEEFTTVETADLQPTEISEFVNSLKSSAVFWFNCHYPHLASELSQEEREAVERLNRIGMGYFRPLVMAVFKNEPDATVRVKFFDAIERFIFIVFTLGRAMRTYRSSEYNNAARALDRGEKHLADLTEQLERTLKGFFDEQGFYDHTYFMEFMRKKFETGNKRGYYRWNGLRYFLYEYELSLLEASRQKKVNWEDLQTKVKDKVSIEHVLPQTPPENWMVSFNGLTEDELNRHTNTLGNLVLLSMSINSALQNDSFDDKKNPKVNSQGDKIRNGYSDGSHSEIEVAQEANWTPQQIRDRGIRLLDFMQNRWNFRFKSDDARNSLLFLDFSSKAHETKTVSN